MSIGNVFSFLLFSAADLEHGLDRPRLGQIKQAKAYRDWADETLRIIEVRVTWCKAAQPSELTVVFTQGMLPPDSIQTGRRRRLRRRINS